MRKLFTVILFCIPTFIFGQSTLLKNVNIVDVIEGGIIAKRTIEVKNGIIVNIHDGSFAGTPSDSVVDLSGKYIIPGLIDSHTHIEHSAYGLPGTAYNPPRENLVQLLEHAVYGGLTTIREMACDVRIIGELSRAAKLNEIASPDIFYPSLFAGPSFFDDPRSEAMAKGEKTGQVSWARSIDENTDYANVVAQAKGNGSTALKLYALLKPEEVQKIADEAAKQGLKVFAHGTTQFSKPSELIENGVNGLSHAYLLLYELGGKHETYPEDDKLLQSLYKQMIEKNVNLDPTLYVFNNLERANKLVNISNTVTQKAHNAGVMVIAGTDSISAYRDVSLPFVHNELKYYVEDCSFSNLEALKTATINAAIALGIEKEIGSVEVNKRANLVILNKNPLKDISNTESIFFVVKDGIIYQRE